MADAVLSEWHERLGVECDRLVAQEETRIDAIAKAAKERLRTERADLLDKRRKAILNDPTGIYLKTIRDQRKNALSGWLSGKPSVAQASHIVVMSEEAKVELERKLTIRMDKPKERARLFDNSAILVIYVINDDYDRVSAYFRTIDQHSSFSLSSMKNAVKGGMDVKQMMEMVIGNRAPTF